MNYNETNGVLTLFFEGRIDSTNSADIGREAEKILTEKKPANVIIDAENLLYLSSAGLRVILNIRKKEPTLKIINVSAEVYDIMDITGFTEMMPVEKAYRMIDVEGCEVIGQGANGKVYRIDPETIAKVYLNPDSLPDIMRERELARRTFILGINTAIPYDVVKVRGGGYASVFELLNAKTLAKLIAEEPENIDKYIDCSVELLKTIHSKTVDTEDIPSMKATAVEWAEDIKNRLPEKEGAKLVGMMNAVNDDMHLMHGDYHVKNVMIQNGEVLLIDLDTVCYGAPVFEFASIFNAYEGFRNVKGPNADTFLGISLDAAKYILNETFARFFNTRDEEKIKLLKNKSMVVGYTRLLRRSIRRNLEPELIEYYRSNLIEAINSVDDLNF